MIDPNNIVREYTDSELEELLIFTICVAGKTAKTIAPRVHNLLNFDWGMGCYGWEFRSPFEKIELLGREELSYALKEVGIGCYNQKAHTIFHTAISNFNLRTCSIEDLEKIKGIGPKTAQAFVMWSRPNIQKAILDTHILKWLRDQGVDRVPKSTPPRGATYDRLEQEFLKRVPEDMTPAEFDLMIWQKYSNLEKL
jgi:thermostable 8-oxoguanine DNA glycosylase